MSLTSFIKRPIISGSFKAAIKKPTFKLDKPMLAPPLTKNYALVGTAFDYLLRFYLKRANPNAVTNGWVAEEGVFYLSLNDKDIHEFAKKCHTDALQHYQNYLQNGVLTDELILDSLRLACIDGAFRGGGERFNVDILRNLDERDIADLRQLMSIVQEQDFKSQKACYLNPSFGFASRLVGGADADIIVDDKLIDIKTTKNLKLDLNHLHQLIGYYILLSLGGLSDEHRRDLNYLDEISEINSLCIYFSRHGYLHTIKIGDLLTPESLSDLVKLFINEACQTEKEQFMYCSNFYGQVAKQLSDEMFVENDFGQTPYQIKTMSNKLLAVRQNR